MSIILFLVVIILIFIILSPLINVMMGKTSILTILTSVAMSFGAIIVLYSMLTSCNIVSGNGEDMPTDFLEY